MDRQPTSREVAESVGKFIEYWGFKHIHGRIWASIYLARDPLSSPELVRELEVSKGLISIAINELIEYGLISRAEKTTHGGQTYIANEDIGTVIRSVLRQRELVILNENELKLQELAAFSAQELEASNISVTKLNRLISLTQANKSLLTTLIRKNFCTLEDWMAFLKKAYQLLKMHR